MAIGVSDRTVCHQTWRAGGDGIGLASSARAGRRPENIIVGIHDVQFPWRRTTADTDYSDNSDSESSASSLDRTRKPGEQAWNSFPAATFFPVRAPARRTS